jgi:hypothetical protein
MFLATSSGLHIPSLSPICIFIIFFTITRMSRNWSLPLRFPNKSVPVTLVSPDTANSANCEEGAMLY